jgi:hypothetical protein
VDAPAAPAPEPGPPATPDAGLPRPVPGFTWQ